MYGISTDLEKKKPVTVPTKTVVVKSNKSTVNHKTPNTVVASKTNTGLRVAVPGYPPSVDVKIPSTSVKSKDKTTTFPASALQKLKAAKRTQERIATKKEALRVAVIKAQRAARGSTSDHDSDAPIWYEDTTEEDCPWDFENLPKLATSVRW